jgi:hypothetical protein
VENFFEVVREDQVALNIKLLQHFDQGIAIDIILDYGNPFALQVGIGFNFCVGMSVEHTPVGDNCVLIIVETEGTLRGMGDSHKQVDGAGLQIFKALIPEARFVLDGPVFLAGNLFHNIDHDSPWFAVRAGADHGMILLMANTDSRFGLRRQRQRQEQEEYEGYYPGWMGGDWHTVVVTF